MRYIASPFASRSERARGPLLLLACVAALGCAETFTLPPVPEAEIPAAGAYNLDRVWRDMGEIDDMVLGGGVLYTLTRRGDAPEVEVWFPDAGSPTHAPVLIAGQPVEGLSRPVAIARATDPLNGTVLYVADDRGPDALATEIACAEGAGCAFTMTAEPGGATRAILARPFEDPAPDDFTLTARVRVDALPADALAWIVLGTAPGRIGAWLEIDGDALVRPVRSDGAFPIPTRPFDLDTWHDVAIDYDATEDAYTVRIDGEILDEEIPVFHPINAPIEILGLRVAGEPATLALDDVLVTTAGPDTLLHLDFEEGTDGEGWVPGPYFTNDPSPAVLEYTVNRVETSLRRIITDSGWTSVDGVAVSDDLTLFVSVEERDPSDPTGVLRRGQVLGFAPGGGALPPLAQSGAGLGFVTQPRGLDYDGENLLVVDELLNRAQKLDVSMPGTALFSMPPLDASEPWFSGPTDITADPSRFIYVADTRNHRVLRFSPEGAFADTVYSLTYLPTEDAGEILSPSAIAADDDEVWIADRADRRVVVLKRAGQIAGGGE